MSVRYAAAILVTGVVAGCSGGTGGTPVKPTATALVTALSAVAPAALGTTGSFEFGDTARLRALAGADKKVWGQDVLFGSGSLAPYGAVITEALGINLTAADSALAVGAPPATLVIVTGGQNAASITAAATKSGWVGSGTLTRKLDLSTADSATAGLMIAAPKIRPTGADVAVGLASADLSLVTSGSGANGGAVVASGTACLGDVVLAQGTGFGSGAASPAKAVGVRTSSDRITSVICLGAASDGAATTLAGRVRTALSSGRSVSSQQPWKELLKNAVVDTVSGTPAMVRITTDTTGQNPLLVQRLLVQQDLPGGE